MFNYKTILSVRVCLLGIIRMDKAFLTVVDAELSRTDGREEMRQVSAGQVVQNQPAAWQTTNNSETLLWLDGGTHSR